MSHPIYLINYICDITGVSYNKITSRKRTAEIIYIRHLILYFLHEEFQYKYSLLDMANYVNLKSHCSTLHSIQVTKDLCKTNKDFRQIFEMIERKLKEY